MEQGYHKGYQLSQPQLQYPHFQVQVPRNQPTQILPIRGKLLRQGGFCRVFLIVDAETGRELSAEKQLTIHTNHPNASKKIQAFKTEINVLSSLNHIRIVRCYGCLQNANSLSMIMEYMPGGSIRDQIELQGPIPELFVCKYTLQILEGLFYLHSHNVIHCDIKGANVLIDAHGNVKLADFGGAKRVKTILTLLGDPGFGTPQWKSPEMITGIGYGPKTDILSLGYTVVEMLTTSPPSSIFEALHLNLPATLSLEAMNFLKRIFVDQNQRPFASELLTDPWFGLVMMPLMGIAPPQTTFQRSQSAPTLRDDGFYGYY